MQPNAPGNSYPQPSQTYAQPKQRHHGPWLILFIITLVLFIGTSGFGIWAFMERQDYKQNSDEKAAAAVEIAKEELSAAKDAEFAEREKNPLTFYNGPSALGSVGINYPKTWSAYVEEAGNSGTPLNGYFHPGFVPGTKNGIAYALRLQVVETDYSDELKKFDSPVKQGKVKVSPYKAKTAGDIVGARLDGEIAREVNGSMVLLPLRDKTIRIWTEAEQFKKDFNEIILPSLGFTP
jgi:hypothetical protein